MSLWPGVRRLAHLMWVVARHLFQQHTGHHLRRWPKLARRFAGCQMTGPSRLRLAIEEMGGTFIKFGQVLALQSDLLPLEYCKALFNLLDHVPAFGLEHVEQTFREELGRAPGDIFDEFDPEPIATGSIGQVHVAMLGGRKVAVKVRRPTVLGDFAVDMSLMSGVVSLIRLFSLKRLYWVVEPTSEFVAWTKEELDYRYEAHYMEELGRHSSNSSRELVPAVFWEYTTRRILTAEFLDALTVLEYLRAREAGDEQLLRRLQSTGFHADRFARNIIDNFLGDAFQHGLFHADLHPANLMILPSSRVGYIDFGIAGVLSPYSRHHLLAMTLAYSRGDLPAMCGAFFHISTVGPESDVEGFRQGLKELARGWYGHTGDEVRLRKSITVIMLELLTLSRQSGIWPQRDVIKYIRSAIAIDGLIKHFAPEFDVGRHLETACDRHLRWRVLQDLVSAETMVGWLAANTHLIRDGTLRTIEVMRRMVRGELVVHAELEESHTAAGLARGAKATRLATAALMLFIMVSLKAEGHPSITFSLGILVLVATAFALSLRSARRSA